MTSPLLIFFFVAIVFVVIGLIRNGGASEEDKTRIKDFIRKIYMFALCIVSAVVGLLFLRLDPSLFSSIPLKTADPTSGALVTAKALELVFGTTSLSIVFDIIFANAIVVLCFLALPMMVGFGLILLCPAFASIGKAKASYRKFRNRVFVSVENAKRTFLVFSHLRN